MAVIRAVDIARSYGKTVALDGVSLSVERGQTVCLVGPNGAGKTTFVRALTGTTDCEGTVELFGKPPQSVNRERLGLLPQHFSPPDRLTVRELIAYFGGLYDVHRPVDELIAEVGIEGSEDTYFEDLSGGQQRRTCVATSLVNDPDLLVLDEPTTGIDPVGRRNLWELLEELADSGTTIVITTHYMEEAERLGDRVGLLAAGELVAIDSPAELIAKFGGSSVVEIEGDITELPDGLPGTATVRNERLRIEDVSPNQIGDITERLDQQGIEYDSLTWRQPDLEDVYLTLTEQFDGSQDAPVDDGRGVPMGEGGEVNRRQPVETDRTSEHRQSTESKEDAR